MKKCCHLRLSIIRVVIEKVISEFVAWKALPYQQGIENCKARRADVEVDYENLGNSLRGKLIVRS